MLWYTNTCILSVFTCSPLPPFLLYSAVICCNLLYSAVLIVPPGHLSPVPPPAQYCGPRPGRNTSWRTRPEAGFLGVCLCCPPDAGLPSCMCFFKRVLLFRYLV
ncbi:unnamed protein product [Boreogadus saida]